MYRRRTLHLLALIAALSLAIAPVACGGDEGEDNAGAGDTSTEAGSKELALNGKRSVLAFDKGAVAVLQKKKVKVAPVAPAAPTATGIQFPITGGTVNSETLAGSIAHSGGLKLSVGGQTLEVTNFVADTKAGVLTATAGAAEIPLLTLDFTHLKKTTKGAAIVASGITGTLTPYGAAAMNGILGVTFFQEGLALGQITVIATAGS
jgi:hypothetical protein